MKGTERGSMYNQSPNFTWHIAIKWCVCVWFIVPTTWRQRHLWTRNEADEPFFAWVSSYSQHLPHDLLTQCVVCIALQCLMWLIIGTFWRECCIKIHSETLCFWLTFHVITCTSVQFVTGFVNIHSVTRMKYC